MFFFTGKWQFCFTTEHRHFAFVCHCDFPMFEVAGSRSVFVQWLNKTCHVKNQTCTFFSNMQDFMVSADFETIIKNNITAKIWYASWSLFSTFFWCINCMKDVSFGSKTPERNEVRIIGDLPGLIFPRTTYAVFCT